MFKIIKKILSKLGVYHFWKKMVMSAHDSIDNYAKVNVIGHVSGLDQVLFEGQNGINERCEFNGNISIGYATTLGKNNLLHGDIKIGRYCQIGADVAIHTDNHPMQYMSTYINSKLFKGELKSLKEKHKVVIKNDVWIGHNAVIIGDVCIGNGVIIAAGAVVTKDVPSYSVVAGVPARIIKQRFSKNIIKELEELNWWDKGEDELEKVKPLFFKDFTQMESIYDEDK